ncbi:hypothetical protein HU200_034779 [Digitaria exilis]|uniref:Uncharacterized protein n=1 Tax=Digitaria exilis TaxID=1010633 RepID=A0A835BIQ2_9POAL|nr:hypothetical protein HU200_034779 [Digitaria exilis]
MMTPSAAATPRRRRRRCNASVSARALAAGLWRLRHAQRMKKAPELIKGRRRRASQSQQYLCHANKCKRRCQCERRNHHHHYHQGMLDKIEADLLPSSSSATMEKATKWDNHHHLPRSTTTAARPCCSSPSPLMVMVEAELEKGRAHIGELEDERRVLTKRLERFLRKVAEEKAAWKARVRDKARHAVATLREELGAERAHRRELEQANAKLMRELAEARSAARRQAESREAERRARELMEEACSELTREVEEDQAEVELLRRECLRMREEMEEERRMLHMAEVWREERVQMKLSDARIALEAKYSQLNHLQADMEAFVQLQAPPPQRPRGHHQNEDDEVDSVLEHFRHRMENDNNRANSPASSSNNHPDSGDDSNAMSPATDLFLAKIDDSNSNAGGSSSADMDYDGGRDSYSYLGTSDRSAASVANNGNGSGLVEARSSGKNTALIRRLWRSAITESRNKTGGWSPSWDRRRSSVTVQAPPIEHGHGSRGTQHQQQQSLRDKLMQARTIDDRKRPVHAARPKT